MWNWVVFACGFGGYVPLAIGGWEHPIELNMATFSLWAILSIMMFYSAYLQKYDGWYMPLSWAFGNVSLLVFAVFLPGTTFNLGHSETIALFGLITVIGAWVVIGQITRRWNHRILFLGSILVDVFSFYPQLKQYLLPHEAPTVWLLIGWTLFLLSALCNLLFVERLFFKLRQTGRKLLPALEESALSIENIVLIAITIGVMTQ